MKRIGFISRKNSRVESCLNWLEPAPRLQCKSQNRNASGTKRFVNSVALNPNPWSLDEKREICNGRASYLWLSAKAVDRIGIQGETRAAGRRFEARAIRYGFFV